MTQLAGEVETRDLTDEAPSKEEAVITQVDPALNIKRGIERVRARIAKWDKEAEGVEPSWIGWPAYRKFFEDMAGAAREKKAELEMLLKHVAPGP